MGLIVLTSAAGSPGATTTAVGLALSWPRSVVLVDADPAAGQAVLAGFLRGRSADGKGMVRVAEAHRERRDLREAVLDQCLDLAEDPSVRRLLLPGFSRPANAVLFASVWPDLAHTLTRLEEVEMDVLVDAGRLEGRGLPAALVETAAATLLVTRSSLRAVAAARTAATVLTEQVRAGGGEPASVVVVGAGRPYGSGEIAGALGLGVLDELADDPRTAGVFSDGDPRPRHLDRSPLTRSLHHLTDRLVTAVRRSAAELIPVAPSSGVPSNGVVQ